MAFLNIFKRNAATEDLIGSSASKILHQRFERQARECPERIAVIDEKSRLSYEQLDRRANQVANFLGNASEMEGSAASVGLVFRQSVDYVVASIGALKAGRVAVPMDHRMRGDNMNQLLCDCACGLILGDETGIDLVSRMTNRPAYTLESTLVESDAAPRLDADGQDRAFLMHTSGTTGYPKSVAVRHDGLANMAQEQAKLFGIGPDDRVLLYSSIFYDASLAEMFAGLFAGATLVAISEQAASNQGRFVEFLRRHRVSVVTMLPNMAARYRPDELESLRVLVVAGSAARAEDLRPFSARMAVFNAYGLTETSVCVSCHRFDPDRDYREGLPIGRPLANIEMLVLDQERQALPVGEVGEICVSGVGLADGYLNRAELTADKFISHPARPGRTLFRTGDRGLVNADGEFLFLGRIENGGNVMENNDAEAAKVERQNQIIEYLGNEGYRPRIDDDGDIMFKREGSTYYIMLFADDVQYYRIMKPDFWAIEDEDERVRAVAAAGVASAGIKVAKVFVTRNDQVVAVTESFFDTPEQFNLVFNRLISALGSAVHEFVDEMKRQPDADEE